MSERKSEQLFNKYRKQLIDHFGCKGGLYDSQINTFGKANLGSMWGGCMAWDQVKPAQGKIYVLNTGNSKSAGIHWIGLYHSGKYFYIYDSFARSIGRYAPRLLVNKKKYVRESDRSDAEQNDTDPHQQDICGCLVLAWCLVVRDLGIRSAMLI
jgi:hypothetical protein